MVFNWDHDYDRIVGEMVADYAATLSTGRITGKDEDAFIHWAKQQWHLYRVPRCVRLPEGV